MLNLQLAQSKWKECYSLVQTLKVGIFDLIKFNESFTDLAFKYKQYPWIIEIGFQEPHILERFKNCISEKPVKSSYSLGSLFSKEQLPLSPPLLAFKNYLDNAKNVEGKHIIEIENAMNWPIFASEKKEVQLLVQDFSKKLNSKETIKEIIEVTKMI